MNILFVCSGNVSRSFLAENLLRNEIEGLKAEEISISSAGLFAYPGNPPDPIMVDYLTQLGINGEDHKARQVTKEQVDWADLILVMEKDHARMMERLWPEVKSKVEPLGKYVSREQRADDIIDPFGNSPYHYRLVQAQITLAIKSLAKRLTSERTKDRHV
ncbi:MAG: hypothetical protein PVG99_11515 [Desulfobacteraceae bacterium]|jgi:protein-tyrosine-phosphatase